MNAALCEKSFHPLASKMPQKIVGGSIGVRYKLIIECIDRGAVAVVLFGMVGY